MDDRLVVPKSWGTALQKILHWGTLNAMRHYTKLWISGGRTSTALFVFVPKLAKHLQVQVKNFEPNKLYGQCGKLITAVKNIDESSFGFPRAFKIAAIKMK